MNDQTETARPTVYPSAVDLWVPVLTLMSPAAAVFFGVVLIRQGRAADAMTLFLIAAGLLFLTGMFTFPCRYTVLDDALSIRCGVLFYQIPFADIQRIERSASLRSGPALSVRRVVVETKKRSYLISPQDRDRFIADLQAAIDAASLSSASEHD